MPPQQPIYFLTNTFEQIERSPAPDIEKVKILIAEANKLYHDVTIEKSDKVEVHNIHEGESTPTLEMLPLDKAYKATVALYDQHFKVEEAIDNLTRLVKFYRDQYTSIAENYQPFFDYSIKLLNRIAEKIQLAENLEQTQEQNAELKDQIAQLETKIIDQQKEIDAEIRKTEDQKIRSKRFVERMGEIQNWMTVLANREIIADVIDARIVSAFLASEKPLKLEDLQQRVRATPPVINTRLKQLTQKGVLVWTEKEKRKLYALNQKILDQFLAQIKEQPQINEGQVEYAKFMEEMETKQEKNLARKREIEVSTIDTAAQDLEELEGLDENSDGAQDG